MGFRVRVGMRARVRSGREAALEHDERVRARVRVRVRVSALEHDEGVGGGATHDEEARREEREVLGDAQQHEHHCGGEDHIGDGHHAHLDAQACKLRTRGCGLDT